jgi:hypothetical protein
MTFVDSYLQRAYARGKVEPYPVLAIPIEVDVSGLPVEERLALSEKKQKKLEAQVELLTRMQPVQGCEGR